MSCVYLLHIPCPAREGLKAGNLVVGREDVTELGAVLTGDADERREAGDITLLDSTGLAIQDLAIAKAALERAEDMDLHTLDL